MCVSVNVYTEHIRGSIIAFNYRVICEWHVILKRMREAANGRERSGERVDSLENGSGWKRKKSHLPSRYLVHLYILNNLRVT